MRRLIILLFFLVFAVTTCNMPGMMEDSYYYIPEVNLGIGVYSNSIEQTVRIFHKPDQVTDRCEGIPESSDRQSTGIAFRKEIDSRMVLSLSDYYRFPRMYLLSGYYEQSLHGVRPAYGYVVLGKNILSFPDSIRSVNVILPIKNNCLEYYGNKEHIHEITAIPKDSLQFKIENNPKSHSFARSSDIFSLPEFFVKCDTNEDIYHYISLKTLQRSIEYRGTKVNTSPNIGKEGIRYSKGFYINPSVPSYIFTGPFDFFSTSGDIPIVISDIIGLVAEEYSTDDRFMHPKEPWIWIDWRTNGYLGFRH